MQTHKISEDVERRLFKWSLAKMDEEGDFLSRYNTVNECLDKLLKEAGF